MVIVLLAFLVVILVVILTMQFVFYVVQEHIQLVIHVFHALLIVYFAIV